MQRHSVDLEVFDGTIEQLQGFTVLIILHPWPLLTYSSAQLQRDMMAAPSLSPEFFKTTEQYSFLSGCETVPTETVQILLTTSTFFFTPRTPPTPIVPIGGHSRFPQSKLLQLLQ